MERLPYIDEHAIAVPADRDATWAALRRVMCSGPHGAPVGFVVEGSTQPHRLALKGRHPFAVYRLVFELDEIDPHHTRLCALTWAAFPGPHGKIYRALVIGTGAHRIVVRRMLRNIAAQADSQGAAVP